MLKINNEMKRTAFTLVEILTVLAIISIMAGITVVVGQTIRNKTKVSETKAMIAATETAASMYYSDLGSYPAEDSPTTTCKGLVTGLVTGGSSPPTGWRGPYIQFDAADLSGTIPNANLIDPWNNSYNYDLSPSSGNTASFNLWSNGPNGTNNSGGSDDITNW